MTPFLTGPLADLRAEALALVNTARDAAGLLWLVPSPALDLAAQRHAEAMLTGGNYSHTGADGSTPRDRILAAGAPPFTLTSENIARIDGCDPLPTTGQVRNLHDGWMTSPPHRDAILSPGVSLFGFGIAGAASSLFAVQTFAGPGLPRGLRPGLSPPALGPREAADRAIAALNAARLSPIARAPALEAVALALLPDVPGAIMRTAGDLFALLPPAERREWRRLEVHAAGETASGGALSDIDVTNLLADLLAGAGARAALLGPADAAGFALWADGLGAKGAIVVVGERFP
ncbi:CAP domain-containing protein [Acuticoccus sediminis]|uniref:CAP domain-containing protein n=1 Tax=Acuticoccus sediminis TaxID=2184697 RepID=UPI001CFD8C25|nr:CAP domain-containing protein [Acuticoccus sediminis]